MKLLVEIDVDVIDRDEFDVDVENGFDYVDFNLINDDEYWNSDFYYYFGDEVNKVIKEWKIK